MAGEQADREPIASNGQKDISDNDAAEALSELRTLLIGPDRQELRKIQERLDDPKVYARDISQTLADAFALRPHPDTKLADAMAPTLQEAFKVSVKKDPQTLVDAISPVMGPAIRKSISDSLDRMMQSLNQTLEYSLSPKSFKWRMEAFRTGKSFAEVVILHTLQFRVEQVFLIHRKTGLLLQHLSAEPGAAQDAEMVSGMLTAIQDFVRDSFGGPEGGALDQARVGELTIWVEHTSDLIVAAVIRGSAPQSLRAALKEAGEKIQVDLCALLAAFEGDAAPFEASRPYLEPCVQRATRDVENAAPKVAKKRSKIPRLIGAALLLALGTWIFFSVRSSRRWSAYLEKLSAQPGIVVTASGKRDGRWFVEGLRDPLAIDPGRLARDNGIDPDRISSRWEPYASFAPPFTLIRARSALNPPAGVSLSVRDRILQASGEAPGSWIAEATRLAPLLPGVDRFVDVGLVQSDLPGIVLAAAKSALQPPRTIDLRYADGVLSARGSAPHEWVTMARTRALDIPGVRQYDDDRLVDLDMRRWHVEINRLESITIDFVPASVTTIVGQDDLVAEAADAIRRLEAIAPKIGVNLHVIVSTHADATAGGRRLARERVGAVRDRLIGAGLPEMLIGVETIEDQLAPAAEATISFGVVATNAAPPARATP